MADAAAGRWRRRGPEGRLAAPRTAAPARLRIVGWMLLTMLLSTSAVVLTVRSALIAGTAASANADIEQEVDEFIRFATGGPDPESGGVFASSERLLEMHLARQFPDDDEAMIGYVHAKAQAGQNPLLVQAQGRSIELGGDTGLVERIMSAPGTSGVEQTPDGELRWGRVDVTTDSADPGGAFIVVHHLAAARAAADATVRIISLVSAGGLLLTVLIGWVAAGRILAPVRLIRSAAAEITERDLTRRIPVRGNDDIAALTRTVNDMLDRLESAFVTQRQFVDDAGHELRTPITIVRGHLELMGSDPAEQRQAIDMVTDELDRMNRIVNDLLVLAKAERPDFVVPTREDVADLTIQLDAKVQGLADRRWILDRVADGEAELDRQRVTQAVLQLAQNAVQHTGPGDEIRIGSTFLDGLVDFWVTDSGAGVRPEETATIFERFSHGTSPRGQGQRAGAGLGLAIVRAIAVAHGGEPYVSSPAGGGATFGLLLPVGAGGPRAEPSDEDHPDVVHHLDGADPVDEAGRSVEATGTAERSDPAVLPGDHGRPSPVRLP